MTKLLIATTVPGTIKAFLLPYADYFREQGWQVDALTGEGLSLSEIREHFDNIWTVKWARNPLNPNNLLGTPRRIQEIVKQNDYDLVHVHTPVASFVTRFALRKLKKVGKPKVIYTAHGFHFFKGNDPLKNCLFLSLEKTASRWTDHLIVINHEDYDATGLYHIITRDKISFHPGIGIDLKKYSSNLVSNITLKKFQLSLGITENTSLFVMIGEFSDRKRQKDALLAFSLIADGKIHLAFVGEGPSENKIKQMTKNLGLENKVSFLGRRSDISTILKAARASILPSKHEGLPRVILESMSMGTPVIASDIRGNRDLLKNGRGLLFPVGDIAALAKNMQALADSSNKAWEIGQKGLELIRQYSIQNLIKEHDELYLSLLRDISEKQ